MALSIRNAECERLARLLADRTGRGMTDEILAALKERVCRLDTGKSRRERLELIARDCAGISVLDSRSPEEILGYDEHGAFPHGD